MKIDLDEEMQIIFLKLKKKFGNHLSSKEVLRRILKEMDTNNELNNKKHKISEKGYKCQCTSEQKGLNKAKNTTSPKFSRENDLKENPIDVKQREVASQNVSSNRTVGQNAVNRETRAQKTLSRYIPVSQKKAALQKSVGKCAYPGCLKPADHFHHTKRFSEMKESPFARESIHESIIPLCKTHHEFAHNGLIGNEGKSVGQWRLNMEAGVGSYADVQYRECRRE
jgi:hypothetical protein